jgi:hypothetical protein
MKLMHHRGVLHGNTRAGWIFGLHDVASKNVHFEFVEDRTHKTLFPIFQRCVLPASIIWSDEFLTYTGGPRRNVDIPTPLAKP